MDLCVCPAHPDILYQHNTYIRAAIQWSKAEMHGLKTSITSVAHSTKTAVMGFALVYLISAIFIRCCPDEQRTRHTDAASRWRGGGLKVQSDEKSSSRMYLTLRYWRQTFVSTQEQNSGGATKPLGKTKSLSRAKSITPKSPQTPRGFR